MAIEAHSVSVAAAAGPTCGSQCLGLHSDQFHIPMPNCVLTASPLATPPLSLRCSVVAGASVAAVAIAAVLMLRK